MYDFEKCDTLSVGRKLIFVVLFVVLTFAPTRTAAQEKPYLNAVKLTFLSWASGSTKISYERAFPRWEQSGELCASFISMGHDKYDNDPLGFTLRYGHKFFVGNYSENKPLDGFFVRPEIIYTYFKYTAKDTNERTTSQVGSLIGTLGYQKSFDRFLVDTWVGAGLALGTPADTGYQHGIKVVDPIKDNISTKALSFSIRLGWLF